MKVVLFPNLTGIAVLYPVTAELTVDDIAKRDVPAGLPYLIVDRSDLPDDEGVFQMAWEADFSKPSGVALGREAWERTRVEGKK